jgi:hypothetical protein
MLGMALGFCIRGPNSLNLSQRWGRSNETGESPLNRPKGMQLGAVIPNSYLAVMPGTESTKAYQPFGELG